MARPETCGLIGTPVALSCRMGPRASSHRFTAFGALVFCGGAFAACGGGDPESRIAAAPGDASVSVPSVIVGASTSHSSPAPLGDAGALDAGPGYRDPSAGDGACTSPNAVCGGVCVATSQDQDNCGRCGNACAGPEAICLAGQCGCSAVGFDYCVGAGCMDVTADVNNCGRCGNVCDPAQFTACESGSCIP